MLAARRRYDQVNALWGGGKNILRVDSPRKQSVVSMELQGKFRFRGRVSSVDAHCDAIRSSLRKLRRLADTPLGFLIWVGRGLLARVRCVQRCVRAYRFRRNLLLQRALRRFKQSHGRRHLVQKARLKQLKLEIKRSTAYGLPCAEKLRDYLRLTSVVRRNDAFADAAARTAIASLWQSALRSLRRNWVLWRVAHPKEEKKVKHLKDAWNLKSRSAETPRLQFDPSPDDVQAMVERLLRWNTSEIDGDKLAMKDAAKAMSTARYWSTLPQAYLPMGVGDKVTLEVAAGEAAGVELDAGLAVKRVVPGSAAARCGLEAYIGRPVVEVNGAVLGRADELENIMDTTLVLTFAPQVTSAAATLAFSETASPQLSPQLSPVKGMAPIGVSSESDETTDLGDSPPINQPDQAASGLGGAPSPLNLSRPHIMVKLPVPPKGGVQVPTLLLTPPHPPGRTAQLKAALAATLMDKGAAGPKAEGEEEGDQERRPPEHFIELAARMSPRVSDRVSSRGDSPKTRRLPRLASSSAHVVSVQQLQRELLNFDYTPSRDLAPGETLTAADILCSTTDEEPKPKQPRRLFLPPRTSARPARGPPAWQGRGDQTQRRRPPVRATNRPGTAPDALIRFEQLRPALADLRDSAAQHRPRRARSGGLRRKPKMRQENAWPSECDALFRLYNRSAPLQVPSPTAKSGRRGARMPSAPARRAALAGSVFSRARHSF